MTKKKATKEGVSNQDVETDEPRTEYERLRMQRIRENMSKMQDLGMKKKAEELMNRVQPKKDKRVKGKNKKAVREDNSNGLNHDYDVDHDLDYSREDVSVEGISEQRFKSVPKKMSKSKCAIPKAKAMALAFKKRQQEFQIDGSSSSGHASQPEMLVSTVGHLSRIDTNKKDGDSEKPRRGPTMCHKVCGRSEDERKEITVNEHGQPVGPDDETCNEFTSFLGTIARKANVLPLTVPNWPKLKKEKQNELWDYVTKHYIVPIEAKKWVLQTIGSCWRQYKCKLKKEHFLTYKNDKERLKHKPKRVPKAMFKKLLEIWNDPEYEKRCQKNRTNHLAGKEKNIMHTTGPKSFARVRNKWKKDRNTTKNPTPAEMLIETRKEKLTKRKSGDLRDKLINELKGLDTEKDVENVVSTIFGSVDKKKRRLNLHGRGFSCTELKQKEVVKELEKKHAQDIKDMEKKYDLKRQQDRGEIANGLRSFFSQFQQQNPHMSFDLSMFGSLLYEDQSMKDANSRDILRLHSSASKSKVHYIGIPWEVFFYTRF